MAVVAHGYTGTGTPTASQSQSAARSHSDSLSPSSSSLSTFSSSFSSLFSRQNGSLSSLELLSPAPWSSFPPQGAGQHHFLFPFLRMGYEQRPVPVYMSTTLIALILALSSSPSFVRAETVPSTANSVPLLQWINITGLLGGSNAPPPLKGASLGYDDTQRNLLIFGGESQQGFPVSQTYL